MIYFMEKNHYGAWVVYGTEGIKQYYGYTKKQAETMYRLEACTITKITGGKLS